ncbi:MAG TPA: serine hydrolase [Thermoanaerobaculia bacterium]
MHILLLLVTLAANLDSFVKQAMAAAGTPAGLAVVVVQGDRVVYRGDFGFRDVEQKLPVTPETRWYLGSTTKAFTAMAALVAAEEGKLDLDAPVTQYWPEVKFTPPLDASRFSIRDFLAMRPGLGNATYNYRTGALANIDDDSELLRILATYSSPQPRTFQYSNMSYAFAAEILERATGRTWQELSAEKVFVPLGMTSTTSTVPPANVPVAQLYRSPEKGSFVRLEPKPDAAMSPAGGTFTTTGDAAKWLIAMLNDGRIGGKQALPKRPVRMAQAPQTVQKKRYHYFDRWGWGIGQDLGEYEGELLVHRFGGFKTAFSHTSFMPERRLGVAVFSNGGSAVADAVAAYAYDVFLGKKNLDAKWSAELVKVAAAVQKQRDDWKRDIEIPLSTRGTPARPLEQYAGTYAYDRLGAMTISATGGKLFAQHGIARAELVPKGGDEFQFDFSDAGEIDKLTFDEKGFVWGDRRFERVR